MVKAGLDTSLPWHTGRKWWQVSAQTLYNIPLSATIGAFIHLAPRHWFQGGLMTVMLL